MLDTFAHAKEAVGDCEAVGLSNVQTNQTKGISNIYDLCALSWIIYPESNPFSRLLNALLPFK